MTAFVNHRGRFFHPINRKYTGIPLRMIARPTPTTLELLIKKIFKNHDVPLVPQKPA